jgi:hypothetical protein
MNTGAVVMLDALGFKGIWKRNPEILEKLRATPEVLDALTAGFWQALIDNAARKGKTITRKSRVTFLSDTIVIEVSSEGPATEERRWSEVAVATYFAFAAAMMGAIFGPPAMAYRGVIAVGDFEIDPPFIVGPAIDEAAELMNLAEAAITWSAPSAREVIARTGGKDASALSGGLWVPWQVPLKGGGVYDAFAVQPFIGPPLAGASQAEVMDAMLRTFDNPRIDIQMKRQNTETFLKAAFAARPDLSALTKDKLR